MNDYRETERDWDKDLAEDVKGECEEKYGQVEAIKVEKETQVRTLTIFRDDSCWRFIGRDLCQVWFYWLGQECYPGTERPLVWRKTGHRHLHSRCHYAGSSVAVNTGSQDQPGVFTESFYFSQTEKNVSTFIVGWSSSLLLSQKILPSRF